MTDLRQAAQQALDALKSGMAFDKNAAVLQNLRTALAQPEQEPSAWRDMVVVNLVREGINKHKARELADHFAAQPEPTCPKCKAAVLYECVACSNNNYPPRPKQEPCIGKDPRCPCQDGDACHYKDCGGGTKARPVAQPEQEPVISAWSLREVYFDEDGEPSMHRSPPAAPEQEPVGWEHHEYRPYGGPGQIRIHAILASQFTMPDGSIAGDFQWLVDEYKKDKNTIKLFPLFATAAQRPWQGLTEEDWAKVGDMPDAFDQGVVWAAARLKERNT